MFNFWCTRPERACPTVSAVWADVSHSSHWVVAGILWIFCSAHLKPFSTTHCALHRHTFGCNFSHVDRCILCCRVSIFLLSNNYIGVHRAAWIKAPLGVTAGILGVTSTVLLPGLSCGVCVVLYQPGIALTPRTALYFTALPQHSKWYSFRVFCEENVSLWRTSWENRANPWLARSHTLVTFNLKVFCRKEILVDSLPRNKNIFGADRWS